MTSVETEEATIHNPVHSYNSDFDISTKNYHILNPTQMETTDNLFSQNLILNPTQMETT